MREINISKNIAELRRKKGATQEQLASALNISPQAISKWETGVSQPDTQTLPLIADYFGVSIDYLFYGDEYAYDDIYNKVYDKVAGNSQLSKESFDDAMKVFAHVHYGLCRWNMKNRVPTMYDEPTHMSGENGLSLLSGRGYGAIVTRDFFKYIDRDTVEFANKILPALSDTSCMLVCLGIISMSDISYNELAERLNLDEATLRSALDRLIGMGIVIEKESKHKSLGMTYEIHSMYHTCLCIILATLEMQRFSLNGISCCMGYGDYPVNI